MKKIRLKEVVPQFEEEEKNNLMTNPNLLCLPPELLVMVASYLDLSSYLTLASSSDALLDILISQRQWETLLKKTRQGAGQGMMYNSEMQDIWEAEKEYLELQDMKHLTEFLRHLKDPEGNLLLALLDLICERFPADPSFEDEEVVSVSCPRHQTHHVTPFGFALLERAEMTKGRGEPLQKLLEYSFQGPEDQNKHLELIASRSLHQKEKVERLYINFADSFYNEDIESMKNCWKVLKYCKQWEIEKLVKDENGKYEDKMLETLAKESSRGTIGMIMCIGGRVIAHTKKAQLKKLWRITEGEWTIDDYLTIRKDEGWDNVLDAIEKVKTKEHAYEHDI